MPYQKRSKLSRASYPFFQLCRSIPRSNRPFPITRQIVSVRMGMEADMGENIKKRTAHDIYYGVDRITGELKHISNVPGGAKCGCNCAACDTPLVARKGKARKQHFAHASNYECMYASEVAVYKAAADIISKLSFLLLPSITISFPAWSIAEQLKASQRIVPDQVVFECAPLQYPPMLSVTYQGHKLRLLFEFGAYYSEDDLQGLVSEAKNEAYSLLLYHFPSIREDTFFIPAHLKELFQSDFKEVKWLRSALVDRKRAWYHSMAAEPKWWGGGYECAVHEGKYKGKYSARWVDCAYCEFNLATPPGCLCLAVDETKLSPFLRKRVTAQRLKNDAFLRRQVAERRLKNDEFLKKKRQQAAPIQPALPHIESAALDAEEARIKAAFDPNTAKIVLDSFNRRWVMCKYCGKIKQDREMASYGGVNSYNVGVCADCARLGKDI